jgi:hypothetical protein
MLFTSDIPKIIRNESSTRIPNESSALAATKEINQNGSEVKSSTYQSFHKNQQKSTNEFHTASSYQICSDQFYCSTSEQKTFQSLQKQDEETNSDVPELIAEDSVIPNPYLANHDSSRSLTLERSSIPKHTIAAPTFLLAPQTPAIVSSSPRIKSPSTPLPSCLKKKKPPGLPHLHPTTQRRVRGLWNDNTAATSTSTPCDENHFERLRDDTLLHCFSFLSNGKPKDLLNVSQVGRRFHSLVKTSPQLWKQIDATDFVQENFHLSNKNNKATTQALEKLLLKYEPESLIIRNINEMLSVDDSFLPPGGGRLNNLTLTQFQKLTDTHFHVMLLLMALPPQHSPNKKLSSAPCSLQHLALEECPELTNATVRSIAVSACCSSNLKSLSLRGNPLITDLSPLAPLLKTQARATFPSRSSRAINLVPRPSLPNAANMSLIQSLLAPPQSPSNTSKTLQSLFGPQPSETPTVTASSASLPLTTQSSTKSSISSLQSLFAPLGTSPQRSSSAVCSSSSDFQQRHHPMLPTLGGCSTGGTLQRIDLRGTCITPKTWMEFCQQVTNASLRLVALQSIALDGNAWTDFDLQDFAAVLALDKLQSCRLPINKAFRNEASITNLHPLANATKLKLVDLTGHIIMTQSSASFITYDYKVMI